jgi:hypothetical protein
MNEQSRLKRGNSERATWPEAHAAAEEKGMNDFGWTDDPVILEALKDHIWGADHEILTNRKEGGVHHAWTWPLGSFDDDPYTFTPQEDLNPIWTRVDLAWGRYFTDGCTFLVWEEYFCRPGTLADAELFVRGLNCETPRTAARAEAEHARQQRERQARQASPSCISAPVYVMQGDSTSNGVTTTTARLIRPEGNRAQRRAAAKAQR